MESRSICPLGAGGGVALPSTPPETKDFFPPGHLVERPSRPQRPTHECSPSSGQCCGWWGGEAAVPSSLSSDRQAGLVCEAQTLCRQSPDCSAGSPDSQGEARLGPEHFPVCRQPLIRTPGLIPLVVTNGSLGGLLAGLAAAWPCWQLKAGGLGCQAPLCLQGRARSWASSPRPRSSLCLLRQPGIQAEAPDVLLARRCGRRGQRGAMGGGQTLQ